MKKPTEQTSPDEQRLKRLINARNRRRSIRQSTLSTVVALGGARGDPAARSDHQRQEILVYLESLEKADRKNTANAAAKAAAAPYGCLETRKRRRLLRACRRSLIILKVGSHSPL